MRPFFGFESPVWTLDGRYIIVKSMPAEEVDDSWFGVSIDNDSHSTEPISVYKTSDDEGSNTEKPIETWVNRYRADLTRIDSITAESQIIAQGFKPLGVSVSQDGTLLVFANAVGPPKNLGFQQMMYDLWIVSVQTATAEYPKCIAKNIYLDEPTFTWCDDRTVMYTTAGPLADGALWAVHIDGKSAPHHIAFSEQVRFSRNLVPPMILTNGDAILVAKRKLWRIIRETGEIVDLIQDWDRQIIAVLPVDRSIMSKQENPKVIIQTREPKKEIHGFYRLDLSSGLKELLYEEPRKHYPWYRGGTAFSNVAHKEKLIYISESESEPPTLYSLDIDTKQIQKIGDLNPEIDPESLGKVRTIEWKLGDRRLKGILMLPDVMMNQFQ